jgi:uncharacterized protein (DUF1800 family)
MDRTQRAAARFGLGARPAERAGMVDVEGWLVGQLREGVGDPPAISALPTTDALTARLAQARAAADDDLRDVARAILADELNARVHAALTTTTPLRERLVWLFSNRFTVSSRKSEPVRALVGAFEREAIRPFVTGRFRDMLRASTLHPAMLLYLDNERSVGPNSRVGVRTGRGLNENLAREVLELHGLGVDGGYDQGDVRALAMVLTGWSLDRAAGGVRFRPEAHEPGEKILLGSPIGAVPPELEIEVALGRIASHPSTARSVCTMLVRHFVSDEPPQDAVDALVGVWRACDGRIGPCVEALVRGPWAWDPSAQKLRTPWELVVATGRMLEAERADPDAVLRAVTALGQPVWSAPSPAGWPDEAEAWVGPEAMARRVDFAWDVGRRLGRLLDLDGLASGVVGPLSADTTAALDAADPDDALTLLIASPEMQRR